MLNGVKHPAGNVETLRFAQSDNHWFVMLNGVKHPAGNVETLRFAHALSAAVQRGRARRSDNHWLI